jgi:3-deoxy-7-phosphoheptulonate synthase
MMSAGSIALPTASAGSGGQALELDAGWPEPAEVARVEYELRRRPPLVRFADCMALRERLARVASGAAHVLQGGDCAELFDEVSAATSARKLYQLYDVAAVIGRATGRPMVRIGRIAGQFAKPRSQPTERGPGGEPLPVYRGDAVNDVATTRAARTADPHRMLLAYDKSAEVLDHLFGHPVYTSHESLLREYEEPLARVDPATGELYGSSGHLLWVGDRSRQLDGPHIDLLARLSNPVAVKLGPTATAGDVTALIERLDPDRTPGRLILISRLGADRITDLLPPLVAAARAAWAGAPAGAGPVWLCDPMHANTVRTASGRKTRRLDDIVTEVGSFVRLLRAHGAHPGGLHLEMTPDDVTECVDRRAEQTFPRYRSACDPRLNPRQARRVAAAFTQAVAA